MTLRDTVYMIFFLANDDWLFFDETEKDAQINFNEKYVLSCF